MRYFTYGVGARLVQELSIAGAVDEILHDGRDIIHIRLISGDTLMIHLIDSSIPLYEIKNTVTTNTERGDHTLFILWADMLLPDAGRRVPLEDWHAALLALHDGRIYGYKIYMQRLYLFPVFFEMRGDVAVIHHGAPIEIGGVRTFTQAIDVEGLHGTFRVANFEGDPDAYHRQRAESLTLDDDLAPYYAVLGVDPGADRATVKAAFREKARRHHPDANPGDAEANQTMQEINIAYEMILRSLDEGNPER